MHTSHDSAHAEILIRRSAVNGRPVQSGTGLSLLRVGEMAYSFLTDNNDNGTGNGGDRLYIGTGNELIQTFQTDGEGDSYNRPYSEFLTTIGGKYFTDMLNHQRGEVTAASALLVDDNKKLNELLVDYLYLNEDSVSTEATNDLVLRGGTGIIRSNSSINPETTDTFDLGTALKRWNNFSVKLIDVNGLNADSAQINNNLNVDGVTTLDSAQIEGDLYVKDSATISGNLFVHGISTLDSTTVDGNLTVTKNLQVTGDFTVDGTTTTINSTILTVDDKQIIIAEGSPDSATTSGAGIALANSDSPIGYITYNYNSGDARWEFFPKIFAESVEVTNDLEFDVIDCGTYA